MSDSALLPKLKLLTATIAALGAALILWRVLGFGVTLITDSAYYIAAARSLLAGDGLLGFDGQPFTGWPPLYPLLLAAASLGIFDPIAVAGPLNAAIFGLTVFAVGQYLQQRLESRFLAVWGCLATALAIPLLKVSSCALSDPLFILLATLALIQTDRFLTEGRLRTLVWAAVFSALAWQTRYIGVAVPAYVGLLLLFHPQAGTSLPQRVRRLTAYSLIVAAPMTLWLLRNYLAIGAFTPHSPPGDYPVPMMLRDVVEILWSWELTNIAAILVLLACISAVAQWRRDCSDRCPFWLFGGFALTYLVLLIVSLSLLVGINMAQGISWRLLTPLYIPLLIAGVFVLDRIFSYARERRLLGNIGSLPIVRTMMPGKKGNVLVVIVTIVLSLGVVKQIVPAVATDYHPGFNGPRWTGSETLRYVRETPVVGKIYSNALHCLSLHIGRNQKYGYISASRARLEHLQKRDGAYVVWFHNMWNQDSYDYDEADLRLLPGLEPVAELTDGVVFKVVR